MSESVLLKQQFIELFNKNFKKKKFFDYLYNLLFPHNYNIYIIILRIFTLFIFIVFFYDSIYFILNFFFRCYLIFFEGLFALIEYIIEIEYSKDDNQYRKRIKIFKRFRYYFLFIYFRNHSYRRKRLKLSFFQYLVYGFNNSVIGSLGRHFNVINLIVSCLRIIQLTMHFFFIIIMVYLGIVVTVCMLPPLYASFIILCIIHYGYYRIMMVYYVIFQDRTRVFFSRETMFHMASMLGANGFVAPVYSAHRRNFAKGNYRIYGGTMGLDGREPDDLDERIFDIYLYVSDMVETSPFGNVSEPYLLSIFTRFGILIPYEFLILCGIGIVAFYRGCKCIFGIFAALLIDIFSYIYRVIDVLFFQSFKTLYDVLTVDIVKDMIKRKKELVQELKEEKIRKEQEEIRKKAGLRLEIERVNVQRAGDEKNRPYFKKKKQILGDKFDKAVDDYYEKKKLFFDFKNKINDKDVKK